MTRVLILGGYGGFGARLSRRLAQQGGWTVLVAGRRAEAAAAFCAGVPGTEPVVADRSEPLAPLLARLRPDMVIDAAGPFQDSGYQVAQACLEAGISYVDLADGRGFVAGFSALDAAARSSGVTLVCGASSVPALSGAVLRDLAAGLDRISCVDMAISASSRATAGPSVTRAILSYVGRPVRLWRGQRWVAARGWQLLRRETFRVGDTALSRLTALADVPDHDVVPAALPGRPATTFRAGPEFAWQVRALWLASWLVAAGMVRTLLPLAPLLRRAQAVTSRFGSDRSAMMVEVKGARGGALVTRRWTMIAERGDGPEIPSMAAELIAGMIARRALPAGALQAGQCLSLAQFAPLFGALAIRHAIEERACPSLYRRLLGAAFETLPEPVRTLHEVAGDAAAQGQARVERGSAWVAHLLCALLRMPASGDHPLHVAFREERGVERWTRQFGAQAFSSELSGRDGLLVERFGPLRFHFALGASPRGLAMHIRRWSALHVPLPLWLAPRCMGEEWAEGATFRFLVDLSLPVIGRIIRYTGALTPVR